MQKIILSLILISVFISSCTITDPLTRAQSEIQKGNYTAAINVLEKDLKSNPNSVPVKSLLAQTYSDYGLALCQDTEKEPKIKYTLAKEQFQKALQLNPYLTDAKEMLDMIEKIQAAFNGSEDVTDTSELDSIDDPIAKAKAEERIKEKAN